MTTVMPEPTAKTDLTTACAPDPAATPPLRLDIYVCIHKAVRLYAADVAARLGRIDLDDADDVAETLDAVDGLIGFLHEHLQHENDFVHPFIEARRPGGTRAIGGDHREHVEALGELQAAVSALRAASPAGRGSRALSLYRTLQLFIAENLTHMHEEETRHNALMWAAYRDDEIAAMHGRLLASLTPRELMSSLRWMLAACSPQELLPMLQEMQAEMPPQVFAAVLDLARERIAAPRWQRLATALGVPAVPGLVGGAH